MNPVAIVHPKLSQASFERAIQPLLMRTEAYGNQGIHLHGFSYPFLDLDLDWRTRGHAIRLRIDGTDFPYRPVSGYWIDDNGNRLMPGTAPVPNGAGFHTSNLDGTPGTWFCFKGWREYHDHPGHQDASWASLRNLGSYALTQMIRQLHWDLNNSGAAVL